MEKEPEKLYPFIIDELGDFVVNEPIIQVDSIDFEAGLAHTYQPFKINQDPRDIRVHNHCPNEYMATRFFILNTFDLDFDHLIRDKTDRIHSRILANRIMSFNPYLLPDDFTDEQALLFGSVFFRIFVASYPGLKGVPLSKSDLVSLLYIATGMAMNSSEHCLFSLDLFINGIVKFLYPAEHSHVLEGGYSLSYQRLVNNDCKYALSACLQIHSRNLVNRSISLLRFLDLNELLRLLLHDKNSFLYLLSTINDVSSIYFGPLVQDHLALYMIEFGFFYEEVLLRPELKDLHFQRSDSDDQLPFNHFCSLALYTAIASKNVEALKFILQLEYLNYFPGHSIHEDVTLCISEPLFLQLRALFLSSSTNQIIASIPNIYAFNFCEFDVKSLIEMFSADFPVLTELEKQIFSHI